MAGTRGCICFSVVILLPVNLDGGHQQTHQNRPDEEPDEAVECQPAEDAEYEEEHGDLDRLSDQPGSKKLIDHRHHADSPAQHGQSFPKRTNQEEVKHLPAPTPMRSHRRKRRKDHRHGRQYDGKRNSEDHIGQPCQETLNDRGQAYPLHHGTNGLIYAIDDPLLMGRFQWNHFLKGRQPSLPILEEKEQGKEHEKEIHHQQKGVLQQIADLIEKEMGQERRGREKPCSRESGMPITRRR